MFVYCKRTGFIENMLAWEKGKMYEYRLPNDYEKEYVYLHIKCDIRITSPALPIDYIWSPMDKKNFDKYFETLDAHRDKKINEILK